ncbi:acyl-CoA dehydrogenase family protein [Rhodococcus sp. NPDC003348]
MDFSLVDLAPPDREFRDRARAFLSEHVTEDRLHAELATGDGHIEEVHRALGAQGWLEPETLSPSQGGYPQIRRRIWDLERRRAHLPMENWGATVMILQAVRQFGSPELLDEVLSGVYTGEILFAMGYTEPEGGSDIATVRTRAVRDGDDWVITGQKMFTTGAQNSRYIFLLTNTNPDGRRHRNLTMFLVPTDTPGLRVDGLRTVDGERTNITFYEGIRLADRYRLGEVDGGWQVLMGPLAAEHGAAEADSPGLSDITTMTNFGVTMAEAADCAVGLASRPGRDGHRPLDDAATAARLGRAHARIEAALSTPGIFGRVAIAQTMRESVPELMDALGPAAALTSGADGAADDGATEHLYRWAPLVGIYGGTVDVFRNMIAQHVLGLGRATFPGSRP